jgi:hypothetical protein
LNDPVGITVLTSKGEEVPFSILLLERELGTNTTVIKYFPEFRALNFGAVPGDEIVLAYVQDFSNPDFCRAIFRSGRMQRLRTVDADEKVWQLRKTFSLLGMTNELPR